MKSTRSALVFLVVLPLLAVIQPVAAQQLTIAAWDASAGKILLPAVLHKPAGDGPFPALVMLSGCRGYSSGEDAKQQDGWAQRLVGWGYVALQIDSFTPRGTPDVCEYPSRVGPAVRSHGGWTIMSLIDKGDRDPADKPFKVAVAFYPFAMQPMEPDTPVRVLIGRKDTWCPASLAESVQRDYKARNLKPEFLLTVYPNATHEFDYAWPRGGVDIQGHHVEYDPEATTDSVIQARDFLAKYLGPD